MISIPLANNKKALFNNQRTSAWEYSLSFKKMLNSIEQVQDF